MLHSVPFLAKRAFIRPLALAFLGLAFTLAPEPVDGSEARSSYQDLHLSVPKAHGALVQARREPKHRMVRKASGESLPVSELRRGDNVLLGDGTPATLIDAPSMARGTKGGPRRGQVVATVKHLTTTLVVLHTSSGDITTTPDHRIFDRKRGWVPAESLRAGAELVLHSSQPVVLNGAPEVRSVPPTEVYNLEVGIDHTFFVGPSALWVHNGTCVQGFDESPFAQNVSVGPFGSAELHPSLLASENTPTSGLPTLGNSSTLAPLSAPSLSTLTKRPPELAEAIGRQSGNTPGGLFKGTDGIVRYVKLYRDPNQAYTEHLANQIYRDVGLKAPQSKVIPFDNHVFYASEYVPGLRSIAGVEMNRRRARTYVWGSLFDYLVNNQDLHPGNLMVHRDGKDTLWRIDNGGSFTFTGVNGVPKRPLAEGDPRHWIFFANMVKTARLSSAELQSMMEAASKRIEQVRDSEGGWRLYVQKHAPGLDDEHVDSVVRNLEERTQDLAKPYSPLYKWYRTDRW